MRQRGRRGAMWANKVRTTLADLTAERALDLVNRQFTAARPDQLWVAVSIHVPMAVGSRTPAGRGHDPSPRRRFATCRQYKSLRVWITAANPPIHINRGVQQTRDASSSG